MKAYEQYKLRWMMDHGYSLEDLMRGLAEMQSESEPGTPMDELFHAWEKDRGFDGSIWACLEEFQDEPEIIAEKIWTTEDVASILKQEGYEPSKENIAICMNSGYLKALHDCTDSDWDIISQAIYMCADQLTEEGE